MGPRDIDVLARTDTVPDECCPIGYVDRMAGRTDPTQVLSVCLHGLGSDAASFHRVLRSSVPDGAVFLDGSETDLLTSGRRWFPFTTRPDALERHLDAVAPDVEARVAGALADRGLPPDTPVDLVSHSQGALLALEIVRAGRLRVRRATAFAGFLPPGRFSLPVAPRPATTAVDLYASTRDAHVATEAVVATADALSALPEVSVRCFVSDTLEHAFSAGWLDTLRFREVTDDTGAAAAAR